MKAITWIDIIFGVLVMPGMMFLFPVGEWLLWHSGYVLLYVVWLYAVFFLTRKLAGPMLLDGKKGCWTVLGVLFLTASATFLMSLTPVDFPRNPDYGTGMAPHIRAMWIMLLAVWSYGLPVGMLSAQIGKMSQVRAADEAVRQEQDALRTKRDEDISGDTIIVKSGYKDIHVPVGAIQYIEGRNNYACFHLDHMEDVITQMPLKDVLESLPEGKFFRIHRSYIIPAWRIVKQTAVYVQLMGVEKQIPIGRSHKEKLKQSEN